MSTYDAVAQQYLAFWNETDERRRGELAAATFAENVTYVDPLTQVCGHDGLTGAVAGVQEQFPGWRFRLTGAVDGHHDQVRFAWQLGPDDGAAPVAGFDVVALGRDGRIEHVHGFLDRVPAGP